MQTNNIVQQPFTNTVFDLETTALKASLSDVFTDKNRNYLNELTLFATHFNAIPIYICEKEIDCKKANDWLIKNYQSAIKNLYYNMRQFNGSKKAEQDDIFYFLHDDLIVNFDTNCSIIRFLFRKTPISQVEEIKAGLLKFKKRKQKNKPEISLLVNAVGGIDTKSLYISKQKISLHDNYNADFLAIHKIIVKRLSTQNDKGIVLLHGKPGTGKTSYIRYLISSVKKEVIFLTPHLASNITQPNLMDVLISNPNCIFVIEDAENIVLDREKNGSSPVTALLNLSDGLLADCLHIQIICSFNTDLSKIDTALLRKGRLIAKYEFGELSTEKAQHLSDKLGFKTTIQKPMTLAEIYNQNELSFTQTQPKYSIGFNVGRG